MPNWKKVIVSGSDAVLNEITSSGGIQSTDVTIDYWGSVSASLASLDTSVSSTLNLQAVTDNGTTTTNNIQTTGNVLDAGNNTGFSKKVVFHNSASNGASSHIITSWGTATYESCVIDYVVYDSARNNKRTGTLRGTWDNNASTAIVLDETTTTDIGTTTGLTLDLEDGASGVDFTISNSTGATMYVIAEVHWLYVI